MNSVFMSGLITGISSLLQQSEQVKGQSNGLTNEQKQDFADVLVKAISDSTGKNSLLTNSLYGSGLGLYGSSLYGSGLGLYGSSLYGSGLYGSPYSSYSVMNNLFSEKSSGKTVQSVSNAASSDIEQMKQEQKSNIESRLNNSSAILAYKKHMSMMES